MKSDKAIWLCEILKEQEHINLNWRVLRKYSQDYDERDNTNYKCSVCGSERTQEEIKQEGFNCVCEVV